MLQRSVSATRLFLKSALVLSLIYGLLQSVGESYAQALSELIQVMEPGQEHAEIDPKTWTLKQGPLQFMCITKGKPHTRPAIVQLSGGQDALRIELDPTPSDGLDGNRDKINYRIVGGGQPDAPGFAQPMVYLSFAIKLDDHTFSLPASSKGYIIAQWWQGAPFAPPIALNIFPSKSGEDTFPIAFGIRNSKTGGNPSARTIYVNMKSLPALEKGKWYEFTVGTAFNLNGLGELEVWTNKNTKVALDWHGAIGYDPHLAATRLGYKTGSSLTKHPNSAFEIYIGPYRDRMLATQILYFKNIIFGAAKTALLQTSSP